MIAPVQLFSPDLSFVSDFKGVSPGKIFNEGILNSYADILSEGDAVRETELKQNLAEDMYRETEDDNFLAQLPPPPQRTVVPEDPVNYDAPVEQPAVKTAPKGPLNLKLSNYGYASDSSPDTNSNVLKIGHSNNKLEDGVSAALTKSLASRLGLKTGDMFEAVTADGTVLKRRYDDTVPGTYKGKPLPETVDLYSINGNNNFGGTVTSIKKL